MKQSLKFRKTNRNCRVESSLLNKTSPFPMQSIIQTFHRFYFIESDFANDFDFFFVLHDLKDSQSLKDTLDWKHQSPV